MIDCFEYCACDGGLLRETTLLFDAASTLDEA